jgi:hypothetical protein
LPLTKLNPEDANPWPNPLTSKGSRTSVSSGRIIWTTRPHWHTPT